MSERYFERKMQPPRRDDEDGDYPQESAEMSIAKVKTSGPEWVEQKKRVQEESEELGFTKRRNIFGAGALEAAQIARRAGPKYQYLTKTLVMPRFLVNGRVRGSKERLPNHFAILDKQLQYLAQNRPSAVFSLFFNFLLSTRGGVADTMATTLGLDEERVKRFRAEAETEIGGDQIVSRAFATAQACVATYAEGSSIQWQYDQKDSVGVKLLQSHAKHIEHTEKRLQEQFELFEKKFRSLIHQAIAAGQLPLKKEIADEQLNLVQIQVIDYVLANLAELWGEYQSDEHVIRIASNVPHDELWHTYVHEMLHALSGKMETVVLDLKGDEIGHNQLKGGVHFTGHSEDVTPTTARPSLWWLNEALTESLTLELIGKREGTYESPRELLDLLIEHGSLDRRIFLNAYFENYFDGQGPHPTPALKKLFDETNAKFGKRFLVDLDLCIRVAFFDRKKHGSGVPKAVALWKEKGDDFIGLVHAEADRIRKSRTNGTYSNL